jgi:hypothetical protein
MLTQARRTPKPLCDPVRRHIASAGERGLRALAAADGHGARLSWALLAFPADVACARIEAALMLRQAGTSRALDNVLLPPTKG